MSPPEPFATTQAEPDDDPLGDLRLHLLALRRHLPLIGLVTLACTLFATVQTLRTPAVYAASASMRLVREPPDPAQAKYAWRWEGVPAEYVNSEIRDMTSLSLAKDVIAWNPAIATELADELGTRDPTTLAQVFLGGVRVRPEETTYVVDLSYESTDRARCAPFANALAEAYTRRRKSLWGEKTRRTEENVAQVASTLSASLESSRRRLEEFLASNQSPLFERQEEILISQVEANNQALEAVQRDRIRVEAELETIQRVLQQGRKLELAPSVAQSDVVRLLRESLAEAELRLAALEQRYGVNWPEVRAARARRDQVKLLLHAEIETIVGQLESQRDKRLAEEQGLSQRSQELREKSRELARRSRLYESLKSDVDQNERFYEEFIGRGEDIRTYSQISLSDVRIVDPAVGAVRVRPNHSRNIFSGLVAGLFLGALIALVFDRLTDRLTTPTEASRVLRLPVLATVPEVSTASGRDLDRYALADPSSPYAEAFRRGRVQLSATGALDEAGKGVLLCTSGVPQEGKTLCAVNLALAAAHTGLRTLLIDADLRNPRGHQVFDLPVSPGLTDCLDGAPPDSCARETEVDGLYLLPAGLTDQNPAALLARGARFAHLVSSLRSAFDLVIVDSPPVALFSDATLLAPAADATALVVSARTSRRSASQQALTELARVGREPVGLLFNCYRAENLTRYRGYYGYARPSAPPPDAT